MIDSLYDEKINNWLQAHRDEIVRQLMALVRIPSVRAAAARIKVMRHWTSTAF